jgi:hypothetical protein
MPKAALSLTKESSLLEMGQNWVQSRIRYSAKGKIFLLLSGTELVILN